MLASIWNEHVRSNEQLARRSGFACIQADLHIYGSLIYMYKKDMKLLVSFLVCGNLKEERVGCLTYIGFMMPYD